VPFSYRPGGQEPSTPTARSNRRATVRYQCPPATSGKVYCGEALEFQQAWVLDLSMGGMGLLLARPLQAGALLNIQIKILSPKKLFQLSARVVHATAQPNGDWLVGCEFDQKLTGEDLDALL
jgi:c-di-GMP-binding flagellar brake protein YcgR